MKFDENDFTVIESLNKDEARAFIEFLLSERRRHLRDVKFIDERIKETKEKILDK
jgi:hypothetical protein